MADPKTPESPAGTRRVLREVLISVGPPLGVYYGLRAAGQSELRALIAATVVSGLQVLYKVVENRRFDAVSGFLLLNFGLSLVIAVVTSDARMAQVSNTIPGILLSLFFMGSALAGRPLTETIVAKARGDHLEQLMAEQNWSDADKRAYHRMHMHVSFWCGAISLVLSAISIAIIFSFSVDVAQAVNQIFSLVTTVGLIVGIVMVVRRYLRRERAGA